MLQEWETRETDDIKQVVAGGDAKSYSTCFNWHMRDGQWRRQCGLGQQMQNRLDRCDWPTSLGLSEGLIPSNWFPVVEAKARARLAYYLVGEFTVGIPTSQAERLAEVQLTTPYWWRDWGVVPFSQYIGFLIVPLSSQLRCNTAWPTGFDHTLLWVLQCKKYCCVRKLSFGMG